MPCCAIAGCTNHSDKAKDLNVSFHKFPKDEILHKQWIHVCQRDNFNSKTARICSVHFLKDDFVRDLKHELLGFPKRNILKVTAFPSQNIPNSSTSKGNPGLAKLPLEKLTQKRVCEQQFNQILPSERLFKSAIPLSYHPGPNQINATASRTTTLLQKMQESLQLMLRSRFSSDLSNQMPEHILLTPWSKAPTVS